MRDLLYVSTSKLDNFWPTEKYSANISGSIDTGVNLPGVNTKVSVTLENSTANNDARSIAATKLKRIIKHLEQNHAPTDFTNPDIQAYQWVKFDLPMKYGKVFEDSCPSFTEADVALFGGATEVDRTTRPYSSVRLLLCGSVKHIQGNVPATGRMGSDTAWLHDFAHEVERREETGSKLPDSLATDLASWSADPKLRIKLSTRAAYASLMNSTYPSPMFGRLRGVAKVLMALDDETWTSRTVLATPLYVEAPTPRKKLNLLGRIRNIAKAQR